LRSGVFLAGGLIGVEPVRRLIRPGATGIVGAAGGATHAANDSVAANAAAICGWKRFMCSRQMES